MPVAYEPGETRTPPKPKKNPRARRQAIREIRAATREITRATRTAAATPSNALGPKAATHAAVREFMRQHGPIGQRTTGQYTPWQVRERKERRAQRRKTTEFMADLGGVTVAPETPAPRGPVRRPKKGLREGRAFTGRAQVGLGDPFNGYAQGLALSPGTTGGVLDTLGHAAGDVAGFFANTVPGWIEGAFPGAGDVQPRGSIGGRVYGPKPSDNPAARAFQAEAGTAAAGIAGGAAEFARRLFAEPIEAYVYTPAFVYYLATDPGKTLKDAALSMLPVLEKPWEHPGLAAMLGLGAKGAATGIVSRASRVAKGIRAGDPAAIWRGAALARNVGMTEVAPGAFELNPRSGRIVPRGVRNALTPKRVETRLIGVARAKQRQFRTELAKAPAEALRLRAKKLDRDPHGRAMSEAIRAVANNTPLELRLARYAAEEAKATGRTKARLQRRIRATQEAIGLGYTRAGKDGKVEINVDGFPELAKLEGLTRGSSGRAQELKIELGLLDEDQATVRIDEPGRVFAGAEFVHETMAERLARYGGRSDYLVGTRVRPTDRQNLGSITSINDDGTASVHFFNKKTMEEADVIFPLDQLYAEGKAGGRIVGGENAPPGSYYLSGGRELEHVPSSPVGRQVSRVLGIPRKPAGIGKRYTGRGDVLALTSENAPADAALREIQTHRHAEQQVLRRQATDANLLVSPADMLARIQDGLLSPKDFQSDYIGVRLRSGTSTAATREALHWLQGRFGKDQLFAKADMDLLEAVAADATRAKQVGFADKRLLGVITTPRVRASDNPVIRGLAMVNQVAKASLLYLKGPGYLTPNVIGAAFMQSVAQGALGLLDTAFVRATREFSRYTPDEIARLRAVVSSGPTRAITYEAGPIGVLNKAISASGNAYAKLTDDFFRNNQFVFEARSLGYHSRDARRRLLMSDDAKSLRDLEEISRRVNRALGDFHLNDFEKQYVGKIIFFYPWIKASTLYAARLPLEHPVANAALVAGGTSAREQVESILGAGVMSLLNSKGAPGFFPIGVRDGKIIGINPQSAAILQGPFDFFSVLTGDAGKEIASMGTPVVELAGAAVGYNTFYGDAFPEDMGFWNRLGETTIGYFPYTSMIRRLTGEQKGLYSFTRPEAISSVAGLGSITPRGLNIEKAEEQAWEQHLSSLPPDRRQIAKAAKVREQWQELAVRAGLAKPGEPMPPELKQAFSRAAQRAARREKILDRLDHKGNDPYTLKELRSLTRGDIQLLHEWGETDDATYRRQLQWANRANEDELHRARNRVSDANGSMTRAFGGLLNATRKQLEDAGIPMSDIPDPVR